MLILGLESSAVAAGAALVLDGRVLSETYLNAGLTHSQTLMTLVDTCLKNADKTSADVDAVAVAAGPGSFTGVRIGVAAAKGLCFADRIPLYAVGTLEAMALSAAVPGYTICPVMDARCEQVYTALFTVENGELIRKTEDAPLKLAELLPQARASELPLLLIGDGAALTAGFFGEHGVAYTVFPEIYKYQHASAVAFAAWLRYNKGDPGEDADAVVPRYLRLSQAERERAAREQAKKKNNGKEDTGTPVSGETK